MCALLHVLLDPYCSTVAKRGIPCGREGPGGGDMGYRRLFHVSYSHATAFFFGHFGKASRLRLATPALHRLHQTPSANENDCGINPPLSSLHPLGFFLQVPKMPGQKSNDSEHVALISWHYDRLIVLPWI